MIRFRPTNAVLILGFMAILACMLGSIYIGFQHLDATQEAWLRDAAFREKVRAAFLMREAVRERSFRLTFATTLDDFFERYEQQLIYRAAASNFMVARDKLEQLSITPSEEVALKDLMNRIAAARPIIDATMDTIVEQGLEDGAQKQLEEGLMGQSLVIDSLNTFVKVVEKSSLREAKAAGKAIATTQRNMIFLSGGAVALALLIGIMVLMREVRNKSRLHKHRDQLAELSTTDALTGIANRRRFDEIFDMEWHQAIRSGLPISLIIIDVDHFKLYNDEYGHAMGDDCLAAIAGTMQKIMERSTDLVARFGGEEFVCVLLDIDSKDASIIGNNIRKAIAALNIEHCKSSTAPHITVSIGVATCLPTRNDDQTGFFKVADKHLYKAKEQGRNRIVTGTDKKEISAA